MYLALMVALVVVPVVVGLVVNGRSRTSGIVTRRCPRNMVLHTAKGQKLVAWTSRIG